MRVLIVGAFWNGSLEESYAQAFEQVGHTISRFDWDRSLRRVFLGKASEKILTVLVSRMVGKQLLESAQKFRPEMVFVVKGRFILPETIGEVRKQLGGIPIVNFNPDSPWESKNSSKFLLASIPEYDVHFTWNRALVSEFQKAGARAVHHLRFAYDPKLHYPIKSINRRLDFDAVFIGTFDEQRDKLLSTLKGCKIGIYGNGWERATHVPKEWISSEAVYGREATTQLDRAFCALNILRAQNAGSHNMRTYEIPATRHLLLTTRSREQSETFAEGEEMLCYESPSELFATIKEINQDPDRAMTIANRGYDRVKSETYFKRVRTLLDCLAIP